MTPFDALVGKVELTRKAVRRLSSLVERRNRLDAGYTHLLSRVDEAHASNCPAAALLNRLGRIDRLMIQVDRQIAAVIGGIGAISSDDPRGR